jgi:hypothetical protein
MDLGNLFERLLILRKVKASAIGERIAFMAHKKSTALTFLWPF